MHAPTLLSIIIIAIFHSALSCPEWCSCNVVTRSVECISEIHPLTDIPTAVPTDTSTLSVRFQNISRISSDDFVDVPKLARLELGSNNIELIEEGTFAHLPDLTTLWLNGNTISRINAGTFENARSLRELHLGFNHISGIEDYSFAGLTTLRILYLFRNSITTIDAPTFRDLTSLEELQLQTNSISIIDDDAFVDLINLQELSLSENSISTINARVFRNLEGLKTLELNDNKIRRISDGTFMNLTNLTSLDLSGNLLLEVNSLTFSNLRRLEILDLRYNDIHVIDDSAFRDLTNLAILYLDNNSIPMVTSVMFEGLHRLEILRLSSNNVHVIGEGAFDDLPRLRSVTLSNNPLICDCRIQWFVSFISDRGMEHDEASCHSPSRLRGTPLSQLIEDEYPMPCPTSTTPRSTTTMPDISRSTELKQGPPSPKPSESGFLPSHLSNVNTPRPVDKSSARKESATPVPRRKPTPDVATPETPLEPKALLVITFLALFIIVALVSVPVCLWRRKTDSLRKGFQEVRLRDTRGRYVTVAGIETIETAGWGAEFEPGEQTLPRYV